MPFVDKNIGSRVHHRLQVGPTTAPSLRQVPPDRWLCADQLRAIDHVMLIHRIVGQSPAGAFSITSDGAMKRWNSPDR